MIGKPKERPTAEPTQESNPVTEQPVSTIERPDPLRLSRVSGTWAGLTAFAVLLVLITAFVLQNTNSVRVSFLFWAWHVPLAVALVVAVAGGILITSLAGTVRIVQLRRRVRQDRKSR